MMKYLRALLRKLKRRIAKPDPQVLSNKRDL
jgi:hypothetical protein